MISIGQLGQMTSFTEYTMWIFNVQ